MRVQTSAAEAQMVPINVATNPTEDVAHLMSVADDFIREIMVSRGNPNAEALQRMAHLLSEFDSISCDLQTTVDRRSQCGVLSHKNDQTHEKFGGRSS